ncbi:MAG TPA: MFS transporter [Cyclobacteriaceae bacterium]|nr:MFS transporter [Cyclobacteriaceae bacterium]
MKNERLLLMILAAGMFTHIMDFMIMMPLGPQLMRLFDITPQQFSLLVASYTVTAGIAGFLAAFLIDRFDRKRVLIFIYTGFAIGTLACAFAPTYGFLLITRSLTGGFGGVLGALILSMVSDIVPLERRAKGIGTIMASFGLASVLGVPFGLFIASKSSWHAPFLFLGILAFVVNALIVAFMPSMTGHLKEKHASPLEVLSNIFGNPNARLGLTFTSSLMLGHFTIIPFIAPYMVGNVGFTEGQLALIYFVGGACIIFFAPWVGKMADKHGRLKIFTIFGTLVIIPILIITNLSPVPIWTVLVISAVFFIFSNGRMVPSTTMETAIIKPENRGSYMSIRSSVQQLTSGLASFVAGLIITERAPIFGQAKALVNFNYVGVIAVTFSVLSLFIARRLTVEQGA